MMTQKATRYKSEWQSPKNEQMLLDLFFSRHNSAANSSDIVYDAEQDRILHTSPNFKKLIGRRCNQNFNQCLSFIKSLIHPGDYSRFLVELVEFVKFDRLSSSMSPDDFIQSFSFRIKNAEDEWLSVHFHAVILISNKIVGLVRTNTMNNEQETKNISARERQILNLIANGDSAKIIGDKLNISPNTVITHRKNLKKKFQAKNTAELIKEAAKSHMI
ncbi:response regulator transcription factor [Mangrovibacterium sp.]|uniref:response regulator transcription factor n=1 Tax=Mangrovibacterium sp. TaxID=1961364 RepID=UPI00356334C5